MSILSITFHTVESQIENWNQYTDTELALMIDNLYDVEKYILSEVKSEMLSEGKNTNLLLIFDNDQKRKEFTETELLNISERIAARFGETVMIFITELNPSKQKY